MLCTSWENPGGLQRFHKVTPEVDPGGTPGGTLEIYKVNPGGTPGETRLTLEVKRTDAWQQYVYLEMI